VDKLLARGAYRAPSLSVTGQLVHFAVDHYHIEVALVELGSPALWSHTGRAESRLTLR